jgi:ribosome-binding factor A
MSLKYAPELRFALDDTFDQMDDTRRLFDRPEVKRDLNPEDDEGEG